MVKNNIRVLIADSQFLITEGLKLMLEADKKFSIVDVVESPGEVTSLLDDEAVDLLITDPANINYAGTELLCQVKNRYNTSVLILTNSLTKQEFAELTKCGIQNIIYKTAERNELQLSIDAAIKGKKYFGADILDFLLDMNDSPQQSEEITLTASEIEIVRLISGGLTTKEIAARRHISIHTVNTHRKNIFRKLNVSNVSELMIYAIKAGLIDNIEYQI